jgi:hypothetical protein
MLRAVAAPIRYAPVWIRRLAARRRQVQHWLDHLAQRDTERVDADLHRRPGPMGGGGQPPGLRWRRATHWLPEAALRPRVGGRSR